MMYRLGVTFEKLKNDYLRILAMTESDELSTHLSPEAAGALIDAYVEAYKHRQATVDPTDMLIAAVQADDDIQEMLFGLDIDVQKLENVADWNRADERIQRRRKEFSARSTSSARLDWSVYEATGPDMNMAMNDTTIVLNAIVITRRTSHPTVENSDMNRWSRAKTWSRRTESRSR